MRLRKNKPVEQGSGRHPRYSERSVAPAFSYYTNHPSEPATPRTDRSPVRLQSPVGKSRLPRRLPLAQAPFWLLIIVVVVCAVKLLLLESNPKVVVLGHDTTTAVYGHTTQAYTTAAAKQFSSSLTNHTKLTVNTNSVVSALERQFPELQTVSITLPLIGNRPIVYVQLARPSVVLQTGSANYALNGSGLVLAKLSAIPAGVPLLTDQTHAAQPVVGKQYLPSSTVRSIGVIDYQLNAAHMAASTFVLPAGSPYELDVHIDGKPYSIKFNLEGDALTQSGAAVATIQYLGVTTPGSYIDVRVPERAYYK